MLNYLASVKRSLPSDKPLEQEICSVYAQIMFYWGIKVMVC